MGEPDWRIPYEDNAQEFEDEDRHRDANGYCLSQCEHRECHDDEHDESHQDHEDEEDENT